LVPPARRAAACVALALLSTFASPARAAQPDKAACARSAEEGQRLHAQGKLREALAAFSTCAADACPPLIRSDCGGWLTEVRSALPTVVVRATAAEDGGHELYDVEVQVDGLPLISKLDGQALPVNPGERKFSFSAPGRMALAETVVVRVGEQHRLLAVALVSDHPLDPQPGRARLGTAPRVLLIAGGAALAASAGFGIAGWLKYRSLRDSQCAPGCDPGQVDSTRRLLRVADLALLGGVLSLAAAAGTIWLRPAPEAPRIGLVPLPDGALVGLRWGSW
jgi:hypothetical protein